MTAGQAFDALVVGGVDSGDADRVVHLLTQEGRLAVFAPNAKRSRRRFFGALEPFTTVSVQIAPSRKRGGLSTLSDASIRRSRLELRRGLETIALGAYFAELGFRTAPEGQPSGVATLVEAGWDGLVAHEASGRLRRGFELRLMAELGYQPELGQCVGCGVSPEPMYIDFVRGGLLCPIHRGAARVVGPKTLSWMTGVLEAPTFDPTGGVPDDWAEKAALKMTGPLAAFWSSLLDRPLNASQLLAEVGL